MRAPAAQVRRLALQANAVILALFTFGPWRAVNVGAAHRTLPPWLRIFLHAMHPTCCGPDCDRPASWTQAAHLRPWATTRITDLNEHLPLCQFHHRLLDDERWTAVRDDTTGVVTWTAPDGRVFHVPPWLRGPQEEAWAGPLRSERPARPDDDSGRPRRLDRSPQTATGG